jgi:clan AA aspartic protease (TIGR02281 family)
MPSLKFNPRDSVIVVETKIWGPKRVATVRLVFDTGASLVILPWKLATGLGLKIDQTKVIQTTTASTVESAPLITVPRMSILGEEVKKVNALVKDLPPEAGVDGLLGLSFIKNFQVHIDFNSGILSLDR